MHERLVTELGQRLRERTWLFATAESCTGGLVAAACTDVAGSSDWFECGLVTYSNEAKQQFLGVTTDTLVQQGAVSEGCVREMVSGLLKNTRAHTGVAISGIAGPAGGSADKPVGTVWFAWSAVTGQLISQTKIFTGNRQSVRNQAMEFALQRELELLEQSFR